MHGVDADSVLRALKRRRLGEHANRALRRVVARVHLALPDDAADGRYVDDGAARPLRPHPLHRRLRPQKDAIGVDVHDGVPSLDGHILDGSADADSGVVDEDIQLAEPLDGGGYGGVPIRLPRDVEPDENGVSARLVYERLGSLAFILQNVGDDDLRPFPRENPRFRRPHPPRPARD